MSSCRWTDRAKSVCCGSIVRSATMDPNICWRSRRRTAPTVYRVAAVDGLSPPGKYSVRWSEYRQASEADRARASAAAVYARARELHEQGDYRQAVEQFRQVVAAWERLGEVTWQGESLMLLGLSHTRMGDSRTATECYRQATELLEDVGADDVRALAFHFLAVSYLRSTGSRASDPKFARSAGPETERRLSQGRSLGLPRSRPGPFQIQDEVQKARDYYAQALELFEMPANRAPTIHNRGVVVSFDGPVGRSARRSDPGGGAAGGAEGSQRPGGDVESAGRPPPQTERAGQGSGLLRTSSRPSSRARRPEGRSQLVGKDRARASSPRGVAESPGVFTARHSRSSTA